MINFGVRGHDVTFDGTPEGLARAIAATGAHNVQFALNALFPDLPAGEKEINPGMGMYFRRVLGERGVRIAVLSCYINMIHPDPSVREPLLRRFEAYLRHARHFGAPVVASETGSVLETLGVYTEANFTEGAYQDALGVIRRLVAAGERYGTIVGIEPGRNHPIHDLATVRRLIADVDSPWMGIVLDPSVLIDGVTYGSQIDLIDEAFATFGEHIVAMHLKDFRPVPGRLELDMCDIGDGVMRVGDALHIVERYRPYLPVMTEETKGDAIAAAIRRYGDA
ncbi:sugar phosphate isomerase/epimerase [Bifidobacterium amazonense]|uniref:Sugar phosphate isomerase/epimerase n=1 Tax=Bifidobacterium amazonense TaxID=2809027 RepID=A0ABS9VVZ7_9BIFI|nr:sugar phosphate isomerase/epimerase family protein [Bifidobacterium amazonense]MCH9276247.1 sugar phosphate isomerase/epimerase [Bifidobacterium amazonense]